MEIEQLCPQHQKQKISWVCLEKNCVQRVMCSTCAVKIHERSHKLEEIQNLFENGILSTYLSNQKNISQGLKYLINGESDSFIEEIQNNNNEFYVLVEKNLRNVQRKIDIYKKDVRDKQFEIRKINETQRNKILYDLDIHNEKIKQSNNLSTDINDAFKIIQTFVQQKEHDIKHNKESEILNKKIQLLNLMKDNFVKMIKVYFSNQFTIEFCKLFDMQMETLNSQDVQDINGFLDYVDNKWKQDYKNIYSSIEKFVSKLHEGLKHFIQLPLQEDKPQKPQVIIPFASPTRQQFQQVHFIPQSPFYNQAQIQQFFIQQPIQSQRTMQQYNTVPEQENEYFAKSQITYEEPQIRNNTRPDLVSQNDQVEQGEQNGSTEQSSSNKQQVSKVDQYIKIQELGAGAYSKVYACQKKEDANNSNVSTLYAMKIIDKKHLGLNKKQHHAFIEKEMLVYLKHDGIIKLVQTFSDRYHLYYILELASECLSDYLKLHYQRLSPQIVQFYIAEILCILEFIHSKGIVHRDLKPENLLLTEDKHLKLIDFGTAVVYDNTKVPEKLLTKINQYKNEYVDTERQRKYSFVGTNAYLSPEMINDQPVSPGTDIWALGILMYKMFTGEVPFKSENEQQLYNMIANQEIQFPKSIPLEAQELINLFLTKQQSKRNIDYEIIKNHRYFNNIDFNEIWKQKPPQPYRLQRKSKTFIQNPVPIIQDRIIYEEIVEKDSGPLIFNYFTPRRLVICIQNNQPCIYYTNPKLHDKRTDIVVNQFLKVQSIKKDRFVIIDDQSKKYIFKSKNAQEWIQTIQKIIKS